VTRAGAPGGATALSASTRPRCEPDRLAADRNRGRRAGRRDGIERLDINRGARPGGSRRSRPGISTGGRRHRGRPDHHRDQGRRAGRRAGTSRLDRPGHRSRCRPGRLAGRARPGALTGRRRHRRPPIATAAGRRAPGEKKGGLPAMQRTRETRPPNRTGAPEPMPCRRAKGAVAPSAACPRLGGWPAALRRAARRVIAPAKPRLRLPGRGSAASPAAAAGRPCAPALLPEPTGRKRPLFAPFRQAV
jgi:hypothetical protein